MDLEKVLASKTVVAIYEHYVSKRKSEHRPHLGGSQIGRECDRALFYQFRHVDRPVFDGRVLRLFETGDREESRIVSNLRAIGVTVWDKDPETGKQIAFSEFGGHFSLSLDGVGEGFTESKRPHTLEFKTMNDKNFRALKQKGVEQSKPVYWAQCQVGMHLSGIDRCAFIAVNKNDDEIYMERIRYDKSTGKALVERAEAIIFADKPPAKLSNDPSYFACKFCEFRHVCHEGKLPEVNCRTCAHATPERDGTWSCAKGEAFGTVCRHHLFNPHLMPWQIEDAGDDWIEYVDSDGVVHRNHGGNSEELAKEWVPF